MIGRVTSSLPARQRNWPVSWQPWLLVERGDPLLHLSPKPARFHAGDLERHPSRVAARSVVLADLGGGASARLSSSFTSEDDRDVDDRDRRHRQQDDDEANRRIDQVRPDREGSAND